MSSNTFAMSSLLLTASAHAARIRVDILVHHAMAALQDVAIDLQRRLHWCTVFAAIQVANDSLSQILSHHGIVTRLPSHWWAIQGHALSPVGAAG